jgi:hypothetical protein
MKAKLHNDLPHTNRRPRFAFGKLAGFFGRWIRCQRRLPAAVGDDFVRATSEPAAVF